MIDFEKIFRIFFPMPGEGEEYSTFPVSKLTPGMKRTAMLLFMLRQVLPVPPWKIGKDVWTAASQAEHQLMLFDPTLGLIDFNEIYPSYPVWGDSVMEIVPYAHKEITTRTGGLVAGYSLLLHISNVHNTLRRDLGFLEERN